MIVVEIIHSDLTQIKNLHTTVSRLVKLDYFLMFLNESKVITDFNEVLEVSAVNNLFHSLFAID